jgi:hypothetical protein
MVQEFEGLSACGGHSGADSSDSDGRTSMEEERRSPGGFAIMIIGAVLTLAGMAAHATDVLWGGAALIVLGVLLALLAI